MQKASVLFLSYDGMTDPLGQSQVIPYLAGLSALGYEIGIVSFEKADRFSKGKEHIAALLKQHNIAWHPLSYTAKPPIFSTLYDFNRMAKLVRKLHSEKPIQILHCRSYITALFGLAFKRKTGVKFIFDMRAFYADERVDGGIWNLKNPIIKLVYNYFKKKEIEFLSEADYTISLTNAGKQIIHSWNHIPKQPIPIEVIPCCADLNHFSAKSINNVLAQTYIKTLDLENAFVVSYLGSLGTWYLDKEMFKFFKVLKSRYENAKFLIITPDSANEVRQKAEAEGVNFVDVRVIFGKRDEVPTLLSLSHIALFFIQPLFSKKGSSPTKHGEILGMGIPVICNAGVGDVEEITESTHSGILVREFSDKAFEDAVLKIPEILARDKQQFVDAAQKWYSLSEGIKRYEGVYKAVMSN